MLEVSNLNIGYEKPLLSSTFSKTFEKGHVVVVVGDNGIGKSTFLKTLAGFMLPFSGTVKGAEEVVIGWVDSHKPQVEYLTIENYLCFGVNPILENVNSWLSIFKLDVTMDTFIENISDGQFRKLAIIRQLLKEPELLILDEPTVYLDVNSKLLLTEELRKISKSCLVFCSTHDQYFANAIGTHFLKIEKGVLQSISQVV